MDSETYLKEGVINRLIPFIKEHHKIANVILWPDLATIHCAINVMTKIQKNVSFVHKDESPPNVPHLRPFETFWAVCKKAYSKLQKNTAHLKEILVPMEENQQRSCQVFRKSTFGKCQEENQLRNGEWTKL